MRQSYLPAATTAVVLLLVGVLVFFDFLFGNGLLLYTDIGVDSYLSYYPEFVHLSHYIRTAGYPSWSFYVGMGQDLAYLAGYLLWQPVVWLPKAWIAYAFVWQHLAKAMLAGLVIFSFLTLRGVRFPAALLGSLLLAFSGYMAIGSCWYPLADEVIAFPLILLGVEKAIVQGRWLLLVVALAVVGMMNPFFLYLAALLLVCYVPLRLWAMHGWQLARIWRACLTLAAIAFAGVALGAVITLPYLHVILNSPRGAGPSAATPLLAAPLFRFESTLHYLTAIYRATSNDMIGVGDHYRGGQNYLEAPLTYCGLVCLLLAPQIFCHSSRRARIIVATVLLVLVVPTIFPWFRYLFWLFEGNYYRTYSLFWILVVITLAVTTLSRYIGGAKLNLWLLCGTTGALLLLLFVPIANSKELISADVRTAATVYLLAYTVILAVGQLLQRQQLASYALVTIAVVELIHFNGISVAQRDFVAKTEFRSRIGYNDETVDAISDIKRKDSSFFYRVTKPRPAVITRMIGLNDALVFDYYGTSSYSSFNHANYTAFLTAVGEVKPNSELHTRWALGTLNNPVLSTFVGEKYALVDDPAFLENRLDYRFVRPYGPNSLFFNARSMPLGVTYTRYFPEEIFLGLSSDEKGETLFRAVVLAGGSEAPGLTPLTLEQLRNELAEIPLASAMAAQSSRGLHLTSFQQSKIEGTLHLDQAAALVIQTPYDRGWQAFENGQLVPTVKVDAGLLGVMLHPGDQTVKLSYRNPLLSLGIVLSAASVILIALGLWRRPRLNV